MATAEIKLDIKCCISFEYRDALLSIAKLLDMPKNECDDLSNTLDLMVANWIESQEQDVPIMYVGNKPTEAGTCK